MTFFEKSLVAFTLAIGFVSTAFAELPQISNARIVQPPPGSNVAAAYFTVSNSSDKALEITGATSGIAAKTEVHLSFVENDVAKMEEQDAVTVEPGEALEFKHGSLHIMFMGLNEELVAGNSLNITLITSAGNIDVAVPVISLEDAMSGSEMEHDTSGVKHGSKH